jgi:hypothetical protein
LRTLALLALALLLGACGGKNSIDGKQASRIVLQPSDLGSRYMRFDEGRQRRADVAPPREDPRRFGRTAGWKARFRVRDAQALNGVAVVESMADVFGDENGARRDLDALRVMVRARTARSLSVPRVGDETSAWEQAAGEEETAPRFFTIAWRSRNATASLSVSGFGLRLDDALALARKQQARLERAAG